MNKNSRVVLLESATDRQAWADLVARTPGATLYQSPRYVHFLKEICHIESVVLGVWRENDLVAVLPLSKCLSLGFRKSLVSLPYSGSYGILGAVALHSDEMVALIDRAITIAKELCVSLLEIRDLHSMPGLVATTQYAHYPLDLTSGEDALWKNLHPRTRRHIRQAQKSGLRCIVGKSELLADFYSVYSDRMKELGTPIPAMTFFASLLAEFNDTTHLFIVYKENTPIAAHWICVCGSRVLNPWASSLTRYRHLCPNYLNYWAIILHCIQERKTEFDFGRSTRGTEHADFKRRWGVTERPIVYSYWIRGNKPVPNVSITNPFLMACVRVWRLLPKWIVRRVGPILAKRLV